MYRSFFLAIARNETVKRFLLTFPLVRKIMNKFIVGETWADAQRVINTLLDKGLKASVDLVEEDVHSPGEVAQNLETYLGILDRISEQDWAHEVDLSVKLTALGLLLRHGEELATTNAATIAAKAKAIGTTITIDMEEVTTTARTLRVVQALREKYPEVGCTYQANLKRTEADCRASESLPSRARLCKGAFRVPAHAAIVDAHDVDLSYVRCLKALMEGATRPLIATHDPVIIEIAQELAAHSNRVLKDFEFQMLYGIRTVEQERLADLGYVVRVYVPFGKDWYGYFVRRLAERPANLFFFLRALISRN